MVVISVTVILGVIRFGIPLLIKVAVLVSDSQENRGGDDAAAGIIVTPVLQTLPEATFSAKLDILGFAQEGLLVAVFVNGNPKDDVVSGSDGEFKVRNVALRSGKNRIWAVARDKAGTESNPSTEMIVISDRSLPVITIDSPKDGEVTNENKVVVNGLVDEEADVTVNGQFVLQNADDSFSKSINLEDGENVIEIFVEDAAGNTALKQIKVTYAE